MFSLLAITTFIAAVSTGVTPGMSVDERSLARRALSGQATFYGGNVQGTKLQIQRTSLASQRQSLTLSPGGMCSFSTYSLPAGLKGTALSSSNWDNAGNCGGCVDVHHAGKSVTAMIVDQSVECPMCFAPLLTIPKVPRLRTKPS